MNDWLAINVLEALGIFFLCGYFGGRLANWLKFPRVTGYIVAGILLSPSVSGIIPAILIREKLSIVTDIALAIIAYSIGGSLKLSRLKQLGKSIVWINVTESLGAFVITFIMMGTLGALIVKFILFHASWLQVCLPLALIIGAVSAATAPAAILAIVHEYRAQGPLTITLLGVVALDDGMAIILYAFASSIVGALNQVQGTSMIHKMALEPLLVIFGSALLGVIFGFFLTVLAAWVKKKGSLLVLILGSILLCAGIAVRMKLSPLLASMMLGFYVVNRAKQCDVLFQAVENIEETIFALFFTLAGAHFDLTVIKTAGIISLLIVVSRFAGKFMGVWLGGDFSHAPAVVKKYLGYALLPTAGVTIGLILMAEPLLEPRVAEIMVNAVLGAVIINELLAPPLVKFALTRAGEAGKE
ncbi:MAG TPA: sodium:proton antiporter [Proteobacteria bacterium]|nr:sodium:proton antiporter [Pseudomonadota bacterium]